MSATSGISQLSPNAFLQMMTEQMQNQDPLNPQSNQNFLAQLAQFSTLQEMTQLQSTDAQVLQALQSMQQLTQLSDERQLIGTNVTVTAADGSKVSGAVAGVQFSNGDPQLVVNGSAYPLSSLAAME